ncbi:TMhelix containing protein [Vibrio phage 1.063.O._10N.261.45.C7]|nr:TMhelix containing protein [Vibrio phage 1.063.O._10N.261.45.C7]
MDKTVIKQLTIIYLFFVSLVGGMYYLDGYTLPQITQLIIGSTLGAAVISGFMFIVMRYVE